VGLAVAAVFVFDEEEMKPWAPSFVRYVYNSVAALRSTIEVPAPPDPRARWSSPLQPRAMNHVFEMCVIMVQSMGGQLLVRVGDPAVVLPAVAAEAGATTVLAKEELEWVRQHRVHAINAALQTAGLSMRTWEDVLRPWGGDVHEFPSRKEDYGYPNKGVPAPPTQLSVPTGDGVGAPLAALKTTAAAGELPPLAQVQKLIALLFAERPPRRPSHVMRRMRVGGTPGGGVGNRG
jgi:hypothetical protein